MNALAGKNIPVLGLGESGLALARWCNRSGAQVTVADTRPAPPQLGALQATLPAVRFVSGPMDGSILDSSQFDLVLLSPGLSPAAVSGVTAVARARAIPCNNELGLFAQALADLQKSDAYFPQVIGITGTNGKTTVTALTGQLVERAGKSVAVAGNIGPTLLGTLADRLDAAQSDNAVLMPDVWVLELSSFQLDGAANFEPTAACVLNISQDHLDWHGTMQAYAAAKAKVYGSTGQMLLNRNDLLVMASVPTAVKGTPLRSYLTFGSDMPDRPGDYGIETTNGMAWLVRAQAADEPAKKGKGEAPVLAFQRLMPQAALRIHGIHNATNALAALALATAAGCQLAPMLHGLRDYRGEPHRVESVAVLGGVEYFDDSKGTNVGATVAALAGLGSDRRLVLILGGEGKGQDFSPLHGAVGRYARAAVLIGRDAESIRSALQGCAADLHGAGSLQEAVALAASLAQPGDAVLLSPACASFDMFANYEHRAQVFCAAVRAIAEEQGVVL